MRTAIIQTRRFILFCLFAIVASAFTAATVYAECSDHTEGGRDCSYTEEFAHCLAVSEQSFNECRSAGGFLWDVTVCEWGKLADDAACYAQVPVNFIFQ